MSTVAAVIAAVILSIILFGLGAFVGALCVMVASDSDREIEQLRRDAFGRSDRDI